MKNLIMAVGLLLLTLSTQAFAEPVVVLDGGDLRGSGVSIASTPTASLILSARHVCVGALLPEIQKSDGEIYTAMVYRIHTAADICLMVAAGPTEPSPLADEADHMAGSILFVETAFPNEVTGKRFPILVMGMMEWAEEEIDFRTFIGYSRPGMSGSPVYNPEGEVVGILIISDMMAMGGFTEYNYIQDLLANRNCIGMGGDFRGI